jgi:hypothetical protein
MARAERPLTRCWMIVSSFISAATTKPRAALKVAGNATQVPDQLAFFGADLRNDAGAYSYVAIRTPTAR